MTVSVKAARGFVARRLVIAAAVATLFSAFSSTLGTAQGTGVVMPDDCRQNLNKCSLQVWKANSFPHRGSQQSIAFTNGDTLACTSNGAGTPRTCSLSESPVNSGAGGAGLNAGDPSASRTPPVTTGAGDPARCADAQKDLQGLIDRRDSLQPSVDAERAYLEQAMDMTQPALLQELQRLRDLPPSKVNNQKLIILQDALNIAAQASQVRSAADQQMQMAAARNMQATADQIVREQQASADNERQLLEQNITGLRNAIAARCGGASSTSY